MGFNNMQEFLNIVRNGNPKEYVMNMLQTNVQQGNPMAGNLIQMINSGDTQGIEKFARNIAKEKGIDYDKEFNNFKQMFKNY